MSATGDGRGRAPPATLVVLGLVAALLPGCAGAEPVASVALVEPGDDVTALLARADALDVAVVGSPASPDAVGVADALKGALADRGYRTSDSAETPAPSLGGAGLGRLERPLFVVDAEPAPRTASELTPGLAGWIGLFLPGVGSARRGPALACAFYFPLGAPGDEAAASRKRRRAIAEALAKIPPR